MDYHCIRQCIWIISVTDIFIFIYSWANNLPGTHRCFPSLLNTFSHYPWLFLFKSHDVTSKGSVSRDSGHSQLYMGLFRDFGETLLNFCSPRTSKSRRPKSCVFFSKRRSPGRAMASGLVWVVKPRSWEPRLGWVARNWLSRYWSIH